MPSTMLVDLIQSVSEQKKKASQSKGWIVKQTDFVLHLYHCSTGLQPASLRNRTGTELSWVLSLTSIHNYTSRFITLNIFLYIHTFYWFYLESSNISMNILSELEIHMSVLYQMNKLFKGKEFENMWRWDFAE